MIRKEEESREKQEHRSESPEKYEEKRVKMSDKEKKIHKGRGCEKVKWEIEIKHSNFENHTNVEYRLRFFHIILLCIPLLLNYNSRAS